MDLRVRYALAALLSIGVTGCIAAEEDFVELDTLSDALSVTRIEAEQQSWSISPGDRIEVNAGDVKFRANQAGDTLKFSRSVASGKYKIVLRYAKRNVYGKYELQVNGSSVKTFDAYTSTTGDSWTTSTLGEKSLSGNVEFKLTAKGRNSSSSGYDLKIDYIELVPVGGGDSGGGSSGGGSSGGGTTVGNGGVVSQTIVVKSGETFDGGGKRFIADRNTLGDGSQAEGQKPVFKLEDGARLRNVVLGSPAADGIHTYGNVTLENIVWEDIGEDALTIKKSGTVVLNGGSARDGSDKVFQINAASTFRVSNFKATNAGKFIRQNGGTTFKVDVFIDRCDISNMKEAIFRTDSSSSTVTMTNTRYSKIGKQLFMGVNPSNIRTSGNVEY